MKLKTPDYEEEDNDSECTGNNNKDIGGSHGWFETHHFR